MKIVLSLEQEQFIQSQISKGEKVDEEVVIAQLQEKFKQMREGNLSE